MGRRLLLVALLVLPSQARGADLLAEALATDAAAVATVEDRLRLLLVHRLADDADALAADVADLVALDHRRAEAGRPPTGLADDARYLAAGEAPSRDARRQALEALLDAHPDPLIRHLAEHRLEGDDGAAADRLLTDDRHNRRAMVVNDAVRPLGIFSGAAFLAALNPILLAGSVIDSLATTAVNLWHYDRLSTPEREALARYQTALDREPRTHDAPEIAQAIRRLGSKRAEALCEETVALGKKSLDDHDLDRAAFYLRSARGLEGCASRAEGPAARVAEEQARHAAREDAGRWPVDDPPLPQSEAEARDYQALLVVTALGDPGPMVEAASRFRKRHGDSPFAAPARYVIAVARDLAGHGDEGRTALTALAADGGSAVARHAADLLASPEYGRLEALHDAERHHARDVAHYVLLGEPMNGRSAVYHATQLGAEGMRAAESLGIFNVIGLMTRAWRAWRHDPVSNQGIIDRGEELLAREPQSPHAAEVHGRLADAYERAGAYERALMHYRATSDPNPKRVAALEGKVADDLLQAAQRDGGNALFLDAIARNFSTTAAADKARQLLRERGPEGETKLDRDVLESNPALLGPEALDLDPALLDGRRDNGELADAGVTLSGGTLRLTLRNLDTSGEHVETRTLAADVYARARAAAQEALYARLITADRRAPESGRYEHYIPFFLQGEVGESGGFYVYPGLKQHRYQSEDPKLYE